MRLGIDFGTTRTIVAVVDRGNYPLVTFETENGSGCEWYPGVFAIRGNEIRTGFAAVELMGSADWRIHRSIKKLLPKAGPNDTLDGHSIQSLLVQFLRDLRNALLHRSNLDVEETTAFQVGIAVPAHATANQRMLTTDAFREAGFQVIRMLDEPSAAGLEYAWRRPSDAKVRKRLLAIYDLGGGTFDASLIELNEDMHEVVTTDGLHDLGGDNFDEVLLELTGLEPEVRERSRFLELCRLEKERFNPNTRTLSIEPIHGEPGINVSVEAYETAIRPLVERSLEVLERSLMRAEMHFGSDMHKHTVVYQVGGASALPTVSRMLRERFGRRVWRSPYPHGSIAIGLAIAAEAQDAPRIRARFTRTFGLWREGNSGNSLTFDPIFHKDSLLPDAGRDPLEVNRRYRAAHNLAHFRFVECSAMNSDGTPKGDITPWEEVRFPLVANLQLEEIANIPVERLHQGGDEIEERYWCDSHGIIEVEVANISAGYSRRYNLHGGA